KAYALTEKIRNWYDKKNIRKDIDFVERDLYDWFDDVIASKIPAFRAVRRMMEKHYDDIINYFREGHTNAKAENMNGKIQRFMANNFGIRDRSFFFFRLVGYFS
ncbi:transposase, partial [Arachidicoccus ginsenosidivorans]